MFVQFFSQLKQAGVPVTLREYLTLMEAMEADLAGRRVDHVEEGMPAHGVKLHEVFQHR